MLRKLSAFIPAVLCSILTLLFVFLPAYLRRDHLNGTLAQATTLTPFFVFLSGFAVSLLLIAKDVALAKEKFVSGQRPFFAFAFLMAICGLFTAFGTLSFVESFPATDHGSEFKTLAEAQKAFIKVTHTEIRQNATVGGKTALNVVAPLVTKEQVEHYVNDLYHSLSLARAESTKMFFLLLNATAAFCIAAVVNLVGAAVVKLISKDTVAENATSGS